MHIQKHIARLSFFFLLSVTHSSSSSTGLQEAVFARTWKNTHNFFVEGVADEIDMDNWIEETKDFISREKQQGIQVAFKHPGSPVIARGRLIFFFHYLGENELRAFVVNINSTFLSSMRSLNPVNQLTDKAISSFYFYHDDPTRFVGTEFNAHQCDTVKNLLSAPELNIKDGAHSEATFLLFINEKLSLIFGGLADLEDWKELVIVGAVAQLFTLKDACPGCGDMLHIFAQKMKEILQNNNNIPQITFGAQFSALVLVAGREPFLNSREGMVINEDPIRFDFDGASSPAYYATESRKGGGNKLEDIMPTYYFTIEP